MCYNINSIQMVSVDSARWIRGTVENRNRPAFGAWLKIRRCMLVIQTEIDSRSCTEQAFTGGWGKQCQEKIRLRKSCC